MGDALRSDASRRPGIGDGAGSAAISATRGQLFGRIAAARALVSRFRFHRWRWTSAPARTMVGPHATEPAVTELEDALARIDRLEATVADQDRTIEELNAMVVQQWKRIEILDRRTAMLSDQLLEMESRSGLSRPADPPPPHW
jgi:SlyX protein